MKSRASFGHETSLRTSAGSVVVSSKRTATRTVPPDTSSTSAWVNAGPRYRVSVLLGLEFRGGWRGGGGDITSLRHTIDPPARAQRA